MLEDFELKDKRTKFRQKLRKGIFILPSFITTLSFFCGFYAMIASFNEQYHNAAIAILFSGLFDFLDGKVARLTNTTSHFGMEYDSLSDLMAFGIAPGFLVYSWALQPFGRLGWMAAFLYVICGALRLARFNTLAQTGKAFGRFVGLPIPAAALVVSSMVIITKDVLLLESINPFILVGTVYVLAFLMVSNVRYLSFKQVDFKRRRPFSLLVFMVLAIYVLATIPEISIFVFAIGYALSGPAEWAYFVFRGKKPQEQAESLHPPRP
ncbi:MAG: CDP-diacylglycerol--serine O-phosphatidyltransferase [Nitrospinae bacterium]|nr:CDP-diacylglycerol--serine O-phosphatidyltransferase [Nitrospinota bacterium]